MKSYPWWYSEDSIMGMMFPICWVFSSFREGNVAIAASIWAVGSWPWPWYLRAVV